MHVSPRFSAKKAVVAGVLFAFTGVASLAISAEGKHSTKVDTATTCSSTSTSVASPVANSKDIKEAEKEVHKAEKEVARACRAQQHAALKAQHMKDQAKANAELEKYNVKLEKRQCELSQAQARLNTLEGNTAVAQKTTESSITLSKPAPALQPSEEPAPVPPSTTEQEQSNITETAPPAAPQPPASTDNESVASNSQNTEAPRELPKTAGSLDLLGLIGLLSMGGSLTTFLRR